MYGLLKENIRSKVYLIVTLACVDLRRLCKDKTLFCMVHVIHQMLILIFFNGTNLHNIRYGLFYNQGRRMCMVNLI